MAESQWEHQAKFAGELFLGMSALVGAYLCFMYAHLRNERARARGATRGGDEGRTRGDEGRTRAVGGWRRGERRWGGVMRASNETRVM